MMGRGGDRTAHLIVPTPCPHPPFRKREVCVFRLTLVSLFALFVKVTECGA